MSSLEQKQNPLEHSNRLNGNAIDLKLWNDAKALHELQLLLEPASKTTCSSVYDTILEFDRRNAEQDLRGRSKSKILYR